MDMYHYSILYRSYYHDNYRNRMYVNGGTIIIDKL